MLRKPLLTTREVAELVKVKEATVRGWIRRGELKGIHIHREWRVAMRALEEFLTSGTEATTVKSHPGADWPAGQTAGSPTPPERPQARRSSDAISAALPGTTQETQAWEADMTALDVLVHVKASKDWTESIDVGLRLAQQLGARAHGLLTLGDLARLKSLFAGNDKLIAERQSEWDQKATTSEARFHQALETHGVEGTWLVGEGHASELLSLLGRVHDLIVVEQNALGDEIDWDPAEETALGGGVPALIVPNKGAFTTVGQCIAIAWNQSREAALAVRGALPLLERAERVVVLNGERRETFASITRLPSHGLGSYLRRKGVAVEEIAFSASDDKAGDAILKAAHQHQADMLVMGAYGRSWFREWVLGGATRHVLRNMDLPVLMAH